MSGSNPSPAGRGAPGRPRHARHRRRDLVLRAVRVRGAGGARSRPPTSVRPGRPVPRQRRHGPRAAVLRGAADRQSRRPLHHQPTQGHGQRWWPSRRCALAVAALTANRWVFFVACAFAGLGLLASQPAQSRTPRRPLPARCARRDLLGVHRDRSRSRSSSALCSGASARQWQPFRTDEWRIGFLAAAVVVGGLAFISTRLGDVRGVATRSTPSSATIVTPSSNNHRSLHVLARFGQIRTLRLMTAGVVVLGFALLGWGLSLNLFLARHFHVTTVDRALLLAADRGSRRGRTRHSSAPPRAAGSAPPPARSCGSPRSC